MKTRKRCSNINKLKNILLTLVLSASGIFATSVAASDKHHHLGLFVGILDDEKSDTVLGIEYEYKFDSRWGVGAVFEKANEAHNGDGITSKILAGYFHPSGGWRLGVGYGNEKVGGHASEELFRYGVAYEFHLGSIGIEPSFNIDTIDRHSVNVLWRCFCLGVLG